MYNEATLQEKQKNLLFPWQNCFQMSFLWLSTSSWIRYLPSNMSQEHPFESKEFCCHFFGEVFQVSWFNELQTLEKSQKENFYFFQRIRWKRILIYFYGSGDKEFADKQQSHVELGLERVDEGKLPL